MKNIFKIRKLFFKSFAIIAIGFLLSINLTVGNNKASKLTLENLFKTAIASGESGVPCSWGYKSTTAWPGNCINCFCDTWNFTGKDSCPRN